MAQRQRERVKKKRTVRRPSPGATAGTLAVEHRRPHAPIRVMRYTPEACFESLEEHVSGCAKYLKEPGLLWFDLDDTPDAETLEGFRALLNLHPLAVADVANVPQRPKHETYENFDFFIARMFQRRPGEQLNFEQLSLMWSDRWVLTFQERPGDCLDPLRTRLRTGAGLVRSRGTDFLAYEIVDAVVDAAFPIVEAIGDRLEELEVDVLKRVDRALIAQLHLTRRDLLLLRRAFWPLRETLSQVSREGVGRFDEKTRFYLRDAYDHSVQLLDLIENYRELTSGLVELYLSSVGFRTNEVMKVLTIISTIFLPLTFIAGVYGMNFDTQFPLNMPELRWPHGYLFSLFLMAGSAAALLAFFWRKGWLGRQKVDVNDLEDRGEKR